MTLITATFTSSQASSTPSALPLLRHPLNSSLRAVASFPLLPDPVTWGNQYSLFRFNEPPTLRDSDPCVNSAILRPTDDEGEMAMSWYAAEDKDGLAACEAREKEGDGIVSAVEGVYFPLQC